MPTDIKKILQEVLAKIDEEERNDLLLELKDRKLTGNELIEAIRSLPDDERAAVREAFLTATSGESGLGKEKKELEKDAKKDEENDPNPEEEVEEDKNKKKRKTRPGRKHGRAYDWYVDDKGKVVVTDVATVYSGEDEEEEVEMWSGGEDEDNEDGNEDE